MARSALSGRPQTVSGVWHGQWNGVHAVTLRLEQNGLSGTARFTKIIETIDGPKAVGESREIPLVNPKFDGERLSFEVQSAGESYPATSAEMEMRFTGEGEADLRRTGGEPDVAPVYSRMAIKMKQERSF
jgi:hypothetical protein